MPCKVTRHAVYVLLLLLIVAESVPAETFVVTKFEDDNGACTPDDCALREAVIAANDLPGADRIEVPGGVYTLTIPGPDPTSTAVPESGDLDIRDELELVGEPDSPVVIVGNANDRVVSVAFTTATFSDIEFTGGQSLIEFGGCVRLLRSTGVFLNSSITGCFSEYEGGGLAIFDSNTTLINTTISNNATSGRGGGIAQFTSIEEVRIINSTISGNSAPNLGGGIFHASGRLFISNSTIARNEALFGDLMFSAGQAKDIQNSILEGKCTGFSSFSLGGNLAGPDLDDNCLQFSNAPDDIVAPDLGLAPLANYGGPTQTHALATGSPAIDAADPAQCEATDQRGVSRPQGLGCDIGAFESTGTVPPIPVASPAGLVGLALLLTGLGVVLIRRRGPGTWPQSAVTRTL